MDSKKYDENSFPSVKYMSLHDRLTRFYLKHNPDKIKEGMDFHVLWGLKEGVHRVNTELFNKYGHKLPPERDPTIVPIIPLPTQSLEFFGTEQHAKNEGKPQKTVFIDSAAAKEKKDILNHLRSTDVIGELSISNVRRYHHYILQ